MEEIIARYFQHQEQETRYQQFDMSKVWKWSWIHAYFTQEEGQREEEEEPRQQAKSKEEYYQRRIEHW